DPRQDSRDDRKGLLDLTLRRRERRSGIGMKAPGAVGLSAALLGDMAAKGIDANLTLSILEDYNSGLYDSVRPVEATGVPAVDGLSVVSLAAPASGGALLYSVASRDARERLGALGLGLPVSAREGR